MTRAAFQAACSAPNNERHRHGADGLGPGRAEVEHGGVDPAVLGPHPHGVRVTQGQRLAARVVELELLGRHLAVAGDEHVDVRRDQRLVAVAPVAQQQALAPRLTHTSARLEVVALLQG